MDEQIIFYAFKYAMECKYSKKPSELVEKYILENWEIIDPKVLGVMARLADKKDPNSWKILKGRYFDGTKKRISLLTYLLLIIGLYK